MNELERLIGCMEIQRTINAEEPDEVDNLKLVEQDGVLCLIGNDHMDYQENHE